MSIPVKEKMTQRIVHMLLRDSTSMVEFGLSSADFVWALSLLIFVPKLFTTSITYQNMAQIGLPEWAWGLAFLGIGICKFIGWWKDMPISTMIGAVPATGVWLVVSNSFINTPQPNPTGVGMYALCAGASAVVGLRALAKQMDRRL